MRRFKTHQITNGGGSVVVSSAGAVTVAVPSGQTATVTVAGSSILTVAVSGVVVEGGITVTGAITAIGTGLSQFSGPLRVDHSANDILRVNVISAGAFNAMVGLYRTSLKASYGLDASDNFTVSVAGSVRVTVSTAGNVTVSGNLAANGAGTHTFAGPVSISAAGPSLTQNTSATAVDVTMVDWQRSGTSRAQVRLAATSHDLLLGVLPSGSFIEAFRLLNASGYMQVASRLGIGVSPSYMLHVAGDATITGDLGIGGSPVTSYRMRITTGTSSKSPLYAEQTGTGATVPVVVVKLGPTPSTGGHAQAWQDSSGNLIAAMLRDGSRRFDIYNTSEVTPTNFERITLSWESDNTAYIVTVNGGTGVARDLAVGAAASLYLRTNNVNRWQVTSTGHLRAVADNTYDIGAAGATRPRDVHVGRDVVIGGTLKTGTRTAAANAANFSATHYISIQDAAGNTFIVPGMTAAW